MVKRYRIATALSYLLFCTTTVWGQEAVKPSYEASPLTEQPINIDGQLDEPVWQDAPVATHFIQQRPDIGRPAKGESFVSVVYDPNNVYIGAKLYDPEPALVYGDEHHRDAEFARSDTFAVLIDTYHDHQNGFFFETNLLSALSDALVSRDGDGVNTSWDGIWEAAASKTDYGWSVEIRIPFKTLRFKKGEAQTWGIQFRRSIPHLNEVSFWSPLTSEQKVFETSKAGHLLGMGAMDQEQALSMKPYLKGSYQRTEEDAKTDEGIGLDLRYRFQTNLTLDLTVNTDFSETEVDRFSANLTRFPLFFPEKREFFLEGANFYEFGLDGRLHPFFSRRIGLVKGTPIPILGGIKLTGKVKPYGIGFLGIGTKRSDEIGIAEEEFGVFRLTRDVGLKSNIGVIGAYRGGAAQSGHETLGVDTTISPHPNLVSNLFLVNSGEGSYADYALVSWKNPLWRINLYRFRVDPDFNPKVGFVQQTDLSETQGYIDFRPQPKTGPVQEWGFKLEQTVQTDRSGQFLYDSRYVRALSYLKGGEFVLIAWDPQEERLPSDFEIRPGVTIPEGTYHYEQYNVMLITDKRRPYSGFLSTKWGGFYDGEKRSINLTLTAAAFSGVQLGAGTTKDWVNLPQGNFVAETIEADIDWSWTPTTRFLGLLQWDREAERLAANLRVYWEYRPGSRIVLVANPSHTPDEETYLILAKATWLWEPL